MTGLGHNGPPRHEAFSMALEDVRAAAGDFLDGAPIETQGQADAIGVIVTRARAIKRDAEAARKEDKEPYLEAGRKVDADYKPVLETADDIVKAAQKPLTVWMEAQEAEQRRIAEEARQQAEAARQAALQAEREAAGNVDATEQARKLDKAASAAERDARKAEKAKPNVAGETRAIGLRTYQRAVVTNYRELLLHIAEHDKPALDAWLDEYARKSLPAQLPGVTIETERRAA